jgi:hypothetical protein
MNETEQPAPKQVKGRVAAGYQITKFPDGHTESAPMHSPEARRISAEAAEAWAAAGRVN